MEGIFFVKHRRDPILISDYMRQIGIIRSDNTVDRDLVCSLFYYESLMHHHQDKEIYAGNTTLKN